MKERPRLSYEQKRSLTSKIKCYGICILCAVPIMLVLGIFVFEGRVSNGMQIFLYFCMLCLAWLVGYLIDSHREKVEKDQPKHKDVFK